MKHNPEEFVFDTPFGMVSATYGEEGGPVLSGSPAAVRVIGEAVARIPNSRGMMDSLDAIEPIDLAHVCADPESHIMTVKTPESLDGRGAVQEGDDATAVLDAANEAEAKREVNERAEKLGLRAKQGGSSVTLSAIKSAWMRAFKTWTEALEWLQKQAKSGGDGLAFTLDSAETDGLHQQLKQAPSVMAKLALAKAIMAARAAAATIAGMFKFATATEEARNLLAIGAGNPAEQSTYKAAVEVERACASMGLAVAWEATAALPVFEPAEEALDSAHGANADADEEDEGEDFDAEAEFEAMPEEEEASHG